MLLSGERQKFFASNLTVSDSIDSHLGHLHSFLRSFVSDVNIELRDKGIARDKWARHFGIMYFMVVHETLRLPSHLIDAAHFSRHVFHRAWFHAHAVFRIQ